MNTRKELQWDEKYSVGVKLIDEQHQTLFKTVNELIHVVDSVPTQEKIKGVVNQLLQYKKYHFATEERYFVEFNYPEADEHMAQHRQFTEKVDKMLKDYENDAITLAFELVDYLEDWLIGHLMYADQKYKEYFNAHGLK